MITFRANALRVMADRQTRLKFIRAAVRQAEHDRGDRTVFACLDHLADLAREHEPYAEVATNDGYARLRLPPAAPLSYAGSPSAMLLESGGV